jgi:hypothetical protein
MTNKNDTSLSHILAQFETLVIEQTEISPKIVLTTEQEALKKLVKKKLKKLNLSSWNKKAKRKT